MQSAIAKGNDVCAYFYSYIFICGMSLPYSSWHECAADSAFAHLKPRIVLYVRKRCSRSVEISERYAVNQLKSVCSTRRAQRRISPGRASGRTNDPWPVLLLLRRRWHCWWPPWPWSRTARPRLAYWACFRTKGTAITWCSCRTYGRWRTAATTCTLSATSIRLIRASRTSTPAAPRHCHYPTTTWRSRMPRRGSGSSTRWSACSTCTTWPGPRRSCSTRRTCGGCSTTGTWRSIWS